MKATRFLQHAIPSKVSQITVEGFANAVLKVWRPSNDPGQTDTIGLAISGGVDSMALAFLCSRLKQLKTAAADQPDPKHDILSSVQFQAFVVDHGVRSGSGLEAQAVSKLLERQGIPTDVLKIQWPEDPTLKLNFESLARKYRFRTLGQACSERGIGSLFLAHHEDDQAETIMMRLVAGHRSKGLMGIKEHSEIPECYGIHGVHESGGIDNPRMRWSQEPPASAQVEDHERRTLASKPQLLTENGGVRVYRPLLALSKQQLTATCQENSVEWFEDHTNRDQTLTKRNAIRHMLATHPLPSALTKPSLLSLSLKIRAKETQRQATITSLLTKCKITHLDLRTGTAKVQFPDLSQSTHPRATSGQTAAELLKRIAMLVSPEQHIELSSLHGAVAHLFPELLQGATRPPAAATPVAPPPAFTVCGVYFQRLGATTVSGGEATRKPRWFVSRQPYPSRAREKEARRYNVKFPPVDGGVWSPWRLWDGRYWIRVQQNRSSRTLLVRPLLLSEWPDVALRLGDDHSARVKGICREKAAGARWTVPAVVARLHDGREVVVALPTFGLELNLYAIEGWDSIKWEIRYKKIDIAGLPISDETEQVR